MADDEEAEATLLREIEKVGVGPILELVQNPFDVPFRMIQSRVRKNSPKKHSAKSSKPSRWVWCFLLSEFMGYCASGC
jgi:hypothetical protein